MHKEKCYGVDFSMSDNVSIVQVLAFGAYWILDFWISDALSVASLLILAAKLSMLTVGDRVLQQLISCKFWCIR